MTREHGLMQVGADRLRRRWNWHSLQFAAVALIVMPPVLQMPAPELTPRTIAMGSFYDGASVHVEGDAPLGSGIIIVLRGVDKDEFYNRKQKFGPVWLNADRIHFQHAPSLFYAFASGDEASMLSRAALDKYGLDETAILRAMRCMCHCKCNLTEAAQQSGSKDAIPDPAYREVLEKEFLQAREQDGVYRTVPRSVSLENRGSSLHYRLDFRLPVNLAAGSYRVQVVACDQRHVIARSEGEISASKAGVAAYIQGLAFGSPWVYGAAAVLIALLTGFAMDFVSSKGLRRRAAPGAAKKDGAKSATQVESQLHHAKESDKVHH
jgi:hypothetical protein